MIEFKFRMELGVGGHVHFKWAEDSTVRALAKDARQSAKEIDIDSVEGY